MNSWIDLINENNNIHNHFTEDLLEQQIYLHDTIDLKWMNIFNSNINLSNEFIIKYIDYIDWRRLRRFLDEAMLERYSHYIVNWDIQLYGPPRTFDFLSRFQKKFNWQFINLNPPHWFNETHYFVFRNYLHQPQPKLNRIPRTSQLKTVELVIGSISKTPDDWILSASN